MSKKFISYILILSLLLCLFAGCGPAPGSDSGDTQSPESDTVPTEPVSTAEPTDSPAPTTAPTPTATPQPEPEITPPAGEPTDPASGTDVIYESETLPPDPASDTDLNSH